MEFNGYGFWWIAICCPVGRGRLIKEIDSRLRELGTRHWQWRDTYLYRFAEEKLAEAKQVVSEIPAPACLQEGEEVKELVEWLYAPDQY